jgi:hypothetical protein
MSRVFVFCAAALFLSLAPSVYAHHPFAADFDGSKPVTVTGKVTRFEWVNPHAGIQVSGRDATGREGKWTIELGSAKDLQQGGWSKTSMKAGDTITIEGWMAKDGSMRVNANQVTLSNSKTLSAATSH